MVNSVTKICKDNDVCEPSQTKGNGKPLNIVSGASTGNAYHHFVIVENEITVSGIMSLIVNCLIFVGLFKMTHNVCIGFIICPKNN